MNLFEVLGSHHLTPCQRQLTDLDLKMEVNGFDKFIGRERGSCETLKLKGILEPDQTVLF